MSIMEITETIDYDERLAAIETRVRNMDALVRGLIAELLDLKTVTMTTSRQEAEYTRQELLQAESVQEPPVMTPADTMETVIVVPSRAPAPEDAPADVAAPEMVRIMQPDGTMKLEPRYGDRQTTGPTEGYGRSTKRSTAVSRKDSRR